MRPDEDFSPIVGPREVVQAELMRLATERSLILEQAQATLKEEPSRRNMKESEPD